MQYSISLGILFLLAARIASASGAPEYSKLWGEKGEKWVPGQPLLDFSNAGYHKGEDPIPVYPVKADVKDFGAKGDGIADDTKAFKDAIAACPVNGAVFVPKGTYKITDWLKITGKTHFAIRGESMMETILYFPKPLSDIHPSWGSTLFGQRTSNYSWSGGYIWYVNSREAGIEDLTFKFPDLPYPGEFKELGYVAASIESSSDCWMKNLYLWNADGGPWLDRGTKYSTVDNVIMDAYPGRRPNAGEKVAHHGISTRNGTYNVIKNFDIRKRTVHCMSLEQASQFNVFMGGKGENLEIDHHDRSTEMMKNLFTDIDMGLGTGDPYWDGGSHRFFDGTHSKPYETYWNIRHSAPITKVNLPPADRKQVFVGFIPKPNFFPNPPTQNTAGPWYEPINPENLSPRNIYEAQLAKRLGRPVGVIPPGGPHAKLRTRKAVSLAGRPGLYLESPDAAGHRMVWYNLRGEQMGPTDSRSFINPR